MLLNDEHRKLWDVAKETVKKTLPPPVWAFIEPKVKQYREGYGTVSDLAFESSVLDVWIDHCGFIVDLLLASIGTENVQMASSWRQ